ncbi:MAG: hypothetical protein ACK50Q_01070 [Labrys sp. (in: a-proteobacteria)]
MSNNVFGNGIWLGRNDYTADDASPVMHHSGGAVSITVGGLDGRSLSGRSGLAAEPVHTYQTSDGRSQSIWFGNDGSADLRSQRHQSVNTADFSNGQTGILATARSSLEGNRLQPHQLKGSDYVSIGSMNEVTVDMAVQLGFLVPDPAGGYREPGGASQSQAHQARQPSNGQPSREALNTNIHQDGFNTSTEAPSNDANDLMALSEPAEKALLSVTQIVPREMQHSAAVSFADTGTISSSEITQLAEAAGLDADTTAIMIGGIHKEFHDQAVKVTGQLGVDSYEDFVEWAEQHYREDFSNAVLQHILTRAPKAAYADLASKYIETLDSRDPEAILTAEVAPGIRTYFDDASRQIMVQLPGGVTTSYRAAVQRGLIRVSRKG